MSQQIIVPIALFAVPVLITWIVFRFANNRNNKNAEIIIKAIENNPGMDIDKLVKALLDKKKTPKHVLQLRLLRGCIFTSLGIAFLILTATVLFIYNIPDSIPDSIPELSIHYSFMIPALVFLSIGFAYMVVYFATRKSVQDEEKHDK